MEPRKIMRNTSGGVDRAGYFRHGRGNRCTKTQVHAAPGNLAWLERGRWRRAWLEVGNNQTRNYLGRLEADLKALIITTMQRFITLYFLLDIYFQNVSSHKDKSSFSPM